MGSTGLTSGRSELDAQSDVFAIPRIGQHAGDIRWPLIVGGPGAGILYRLRQRRGSKNAASKAAASRAAMPP
jgi:hypothetical protein